MKKTLLLCFIHGFKGDDGTFGELPPHLKALVSNALPQLNVVTAIYPQYETRGDLASCVARFRDWLQTRVIDIEVEAGTPSPMIDPSVRTILVAHSMGGIVAADTLLSILDDKTISSSNEVFMFPYIQGILAFDTPFIGLTPALFAHAADKNIKSASAALSTLASGIFASKAVDKKKEANATEGGGGWGSWGKVAAYAGVAAVLAGGAGAAYLKRDEIAQGAGWATNWISSHLEFVSALYKGEELRNRSNRASTVAGVGFANLHTSLGKPSAATSATAVVTPERTFVVVPSLGSTLRKHWVKCINPKATDEVNAHVSMFTPAGNPGYYDMSNKARDLVVKWVNDGWDFSHGRFSPGYESDNSAGRKGSRDWNEEKYERRESSDHRDGSRDSRDVRVVRRDSGDPNIVRRDSGRDIRTVRRDSGGGDVRAARRDSGDVRIRRDSGDTRSVRRDSRDSRDTRIRRNNDDVASRDSRGSGSRDLMDYREMRDGKRDSRERL